MALKKTNKKYFFSVEGETEKWYLEWLATQINSIDTASHTVSFKIKIEKNPKKMVKSLTISGKTNIWHFSDYESEEAVHVQQFTETMDNLKAAQELGKQVTYYFGYSNFAFDLWIVLHKSECNQSLIHRNKYLSYINSSYNENFSSMDDYKSEDNFKRCLQKLDIDSVKKAICRAEKIDQNNKDCGYTLYEYKGYTYYKENPSTDVWKCIKSVLKDCNLIDTRN